MDDSPNRRIPADVALDRPGLEGNAVAASDRTTAAWSHALVLVPLAFSAWVYLPITHVYFWADDFLNLTDLVARDRLDFLLSPVGGHNLLVWRVGCGSGVWAIVPPSGSVRVSSRSASRGAPAPLSRFSNATQSWRRGLRDRSCARFLGCWAAAGSRAHADRLTAGLLRA
jgi:hypothetical protein